jgi:hypothetical protein
MMRSVFSIFISLFLFSACSSGDQNISTPQDANGLEVTSGLHQGTNLGNDDQDAVFAAAVVHLLLGGALKYQLTYERLPTTQNVQSKTASVSVGIESESSTFEKDFLFPSIYLKASGAYDRIQSEGASGPVYFVNPLSINIVFNNLSKQIDGQGVELDGNLHCEVEGHYTVETQKFLGRGFCTTESDEGDTITVIKAGVASTVHLDATIEIHGEALNLGSIMPSGNILINDRGYVIEDLPSIEE